MDSPNSPGFPGWRVPSPRSIKYEKPVKHMLKRTMKTANLLVLSSENLPCILQKFLVQFTRNLTRFFRFVDVHFCFPVVQIKEIVELFRHYRGSVFVVQIVARRFDAERRLQIIGRSLEEFQNDFDKVFLIRSGNDSFQHACQILAEGFSSFALSANKIRARIY